MIIKAKRTLDRARRPHDPGRIVAELNFGFWTGLYGREHENAIVRPTLAATFPHLAGRAVRATVSEPLRDARLLRNRVSHHEHICFDAALPAKYFAIIRLIEWMSPQAADAVAIDDEFKKIYGSSWTPYRPILEQLYG